MMRSNDYEAHFYLYYLNIFVTFDESHAKKTRKTQTSTC